MNDHIWIGQDDWVVNEEVAESHVSLELKHGGLSYSFGLTEADAREIGNALLKAADGVKRRQSRDW